MKYIENVYSFEIYELGYMHYLIIYRGNTVEELKGYGLNSVRSHIYNHLI